MTMLGHMTTYRYLRELAQMEREHIIRVLREMNGVVTKSAARLGLPRTTLSAMMRKLGICRKDL